MVGFISIIIRPIQIQEFDPTPHQLKSNNKTQHENITTLSKSAIVDANCNYPQNLAQTPLLQKEKFAL
jgi:hypothetical protein